MNRIDKCFQQKEKNILSIYFTAGFPELNDTLRIIKALEKHGADMIEIGIPFSDPVADGPVIQASSKKALGNGMNVKLLFEQLKDLRNVTDMPVILMGYLNPVFKAGWDNFLQNCVSVGIDGLIIPDFTPEEYEREYLGKFLSHNIHNILLVTPQTGYERIRYLDRLSRGFLYMVSSYSTTGAQQGFGQAQEAYFQKLQKMELNNPLMVGFGISDHQTFSMAGRYASGGIIGSAFIKALEENREMEAKVGEFIQKIRGRR